MIKEKILGVDIMIHGTLTEDVEIIKLVPIVEIAAPGLM